MRRTMKFFHTLGAIGLMGAMACLLVLIASLPPPSALGEYARMRTAMAAIGSWVFLPSLALTLVAGLLSMAVNRGYHSAGWALAKLATGILIFEWCFAGIQGPLQNEAELTAKVLAKEADASLLGTTTSAEWNSLWVLIAVAAVNVVLGVFRPRFTNLPD